MDAIEGIVDNELKATKLQTIIVNLLGRPVTKVEALDGLQLHIDGDGGNTVGWKYDAKVNNKLELSWNQHTILGDAICDLGRLVYKNPEIKWAFPESYRAWKQPENEGNVKYM